MATTSSGEELEQFVAFVEKILLPPGFTVETRKRFYGESGQIAELDILIKGKVGSTTFDWLIECRDRPSAGAVDASWIEQLVGRRDRFNFSKVTAVSTTGFTEAARDFARQKGIELREVVRFEASEFSSWLNIRTYRLKRRVSKLIHAKLWFPESMAVEARNAANKFVRLADTTAEILYSKNQGTKVTLNMAFFGLIQENAHWFDVVAVGTVIPVQVRAIYGSDVERLWIETEIGPIEVPEIEFTGELSTEETEVPLVETKEYRDADGASIISQTAVFEPQNVLGSNLALEFHRIEQSGETHVVMRKIA